MMWLRKNKDKRDTMKTLIEKVAVVTGAGSGIGQALAIELAKAGAHLAISDINEEGLKATVEKINSIAPSTKVHTHKLDVSDRDAMNQYAQLIKEEYGVINLLINNAGVALSAALSEVKREDFNWLMNINFWGVVNGCEAFLPILRQADDAHIVNISSVFGMVAVPKQGTYNAAKFAVRGYSECLRQEMSLVSPNVKVSTVHPGGIATEIARNARVSEGDNKEELAATFDKMAKTTPTQAAQIILAGVKKDKARIMVGWDAHLIHFLYRLLGAGYMKLTQALAKSKMHLAEK